MKSPAARRRIATRAAWGRLHMKFVSKLSPEQWAEARCLRAGGATFPQIAARFGLSASTIRARARLSNRDRLFTPGLFARVKLGEGATHPAILIEDRAVGTDQTRRFVYVVKADNSLEYRPVELGGLHEGLRVVRDGLKPGERIVVNGLMRVRPGVTVDPQVIAMRLPDGEQGRQMLAGNAP